MIYLHKNGVTIVADKKAKVGQTYELNGEKYLVVNRKMLENLVNSGKDVTKVVTTRVSMMLFLFAGETNFNQDISSWDVSNVGSMTSMFARAKKFNQDIGKWNVNNASQMESMFEGAHSFNCDISNWNICGYANLRKMFANAFSFNQPIGKWKLDPYCDISYMFLNAKSFNQDLNHWNVKKILSMISLFEGAESFNQDLDLWDLAKNNYKGLSLNRMFKNAKKFNGNISTWKFDGITRMDEMFAGATSFNQDISVWDVSKVVKMDKLFNGAESFNQNLSDWNIHDKLKIKTPSAIFTGAKKFNPEHSPFQKKKRSINTSTKNLTSEDKKTFSKIKKLLLSRDIDKIDLAIELFISLNNTELFNTLLDGCKLETIDSSEPNHFESKLRTNKIFTGTGPAQPLLNYALMNIIASVPTDQNIKIHESIIIKNIHRLNISTIIGFNNNYDRFNQFFEIDKFTYVKKIIIDFSKFENINFLDYLKNECVKEFTAMNVTGSLKWLNNFNNLKVLKLSPSWNDQVQDHEVFNSLINLEELEIRCSNDITFLENCIKIKKLKLNISAAVSTINIDALKYLINLEELEIIDTTKQEMQTFNASVLSSCKKLNKLIYRTEMDRVEEENGRYFSLKTIDMRLCQVENVLKNIRQCEKLESLSIFTKSDYNWIKEEGALLHLGVEISSFNGLKIPPNLRQIKINEIELLPIKNNY